MIDTLQGYGSIISLLQRPIYIIYNAKNKFIDSSENISEHLLETNCFAIRYYFYYSQKT